MCVCVSVCVVKHDLVCDGHVPNLLFFYQLISLGITPYLATVILLPLAGYAANEIFTLTFMIARLTSLISQVIGARTYICIGASRSECTLKNVGSIMEGMNSTQ